MNLTTDIRPRTPLRELLLAGIAAVLLISFSLQSRPPPPVPIQDAASYVRLALGLSEHGVFGYFRSLDTEPKADAEVAPLYPAFLAVLIRLDPDLRKSLVCLMNGSPQTGPACTQAFATLTLAQGLLMALFLVSVWHTAWLLSRRRALAWMAMLLAMLSGLPTQYAGLFLTEALVLPLFGFLLLSLALVYLDPVRRRHWVLCLGLVLGLLALTRPTFMYLFWFILIAVILIAVRLRSQAWIPRFLAIFCLGFALFTLPWAARNALQIGQLSLSAGQYGGRTLAQRVSYNSMTAPEWGVAFVYWFPDIGDSLARSLFPPRLYKRLGWGPDSFYRAGTVHMHDVLKATRGGDSSPVRYMLVHQVLGRPLKHALVTLALAWRGMFISKYWGIFGWISALWLLGRTLRRGRYAYAVLWVPGLFMVGFHAAVSVSITRYNIILTPLLAIALAYVLLDLFQRRVRIRLPACAGAGLPVSELYASRDPGAAP